MENPFETILNRISDLERQIQALNSKISPPAAQNNTDENLTIEELSEAIKTPIPTIRRKANQIGFIKHGRRLLFRRSVIQRFMEANAVKGRAQVQSEAIERLKMKS